MNFNSEIEVRWFFFLLLLDFVVCLGPQLFSVANTKPEEYSSRREEAAHSSMGYFVANALIRQTGSPFTLMIKSMFCFK